ncbi:ArgS-related anticodon-binding protein NrtL, partial [Streptomyces sp. NPDC000405]|uniref:ArgS-related anticodon-binding protein NrtL n=1 Tax=Streptomyces sp. NPDC000405 TaxID=3161033 RepID=UPI00398D0A90
MTPVELSRTVLRAVRRAVDGGELSVTVPERVVVTAPGPGGCGDYATNVALQLARPAGKPALRVAEILRPHLTDAQGVGDVVVTGPGFLNISLEPGTASVGALVREIRDRGAAYGHGDALAGQIVALCVPYEARAEVVADALVRIVAAQGGRVEIEHGEPVNLRPVPAPEDPAPLGPDAARWALLYPAPHDRPRITADHLVQREGNPLFRVRYAYARTRALTRNAARLGFTAEPGDDLDDLTDWPPATGPMAAPAGPRGTGTAPSARPAVTPVDGDVTDPAAVTGPAGVPARPRGTGTAPSAHPTVTPAGGDPTDSPAVTGPTAAPAGPKLTDTATPAGGILAARPPAAAVRRLLAVLADHPRILRAAAVDRGPDRIARHLVVVADAALPFLLTVLPHGEEKPSAAHRARLALADETVSPHRRVRHDSPQQPLDRLAGV